MGCICSKAIKVKDPSHNNKDKDQTKSSSKLFLNSSRRDIAAVADADVIPASKPQPNVVLHGFLAEHVAAGWPAWLTSVASEAKLDKIGQGTYSSVYKARDLETGKFVALKKVRFINMDPESVRFMAREIHILRKLDHPNVLKLQGIVTSRMSGSLYLVFEYMEHDLAGLAATPGIKFSESQVKCFMKQLFSGLDHCHSQGVLHRDIKGSNLLIDGNGILKIGDFGLATFFHPDQKQQMTSRVVTLWYRPPELLLGATDYGVGVDLWSTGCILAELCAGKPIMPGRTEVEQMHRIFKLCGSPSEEFWSTSNLSHATSFNPQRTYRRCIRETFKDFPASALALLDTLLAIEPAERGTAASALQSDFFRTKPLACDPSSLPKYPSSKELSVKLRDEENKSGSKHNAQEDDRSRLPLSPPAVSGHGHSTRHGVSVNHRTVPNRSTTTLGRSTGRQLKTQRSFKPQEEGADFDNFAGFGTVKNNAKPDNHRDPTKKSNRTEHRSNNKYNQLDVADGSNHALDRPCSSHQKDIGIKETTTGYGTKKKIIHYSGPLMSSGRSMEEMLKEHERQIQEAVRKARIDKDKNRKDFI
ncbi:[RNA-polymerase]-subunit kinase protein [Dioscorea alata]|uniref:[RNA-polymerase]-subunit kinase protein n=1 Tax=Dioscorea alata TaxID=55571 RepID=A0ACB7WAY5_DIOAL|nr:[RNA-polymerase]-subunit kinase protein [Dioscorea alata]